MTDFFATGYSERWDTIEPTPEEIERQVQDAEYRAYMRYLRDTGVFARLAEQDALDPLNAA